MPSYFLEAVQPKYVQQCVTFAGEEPAQFSVWTMVIETDLYAERDTAALELPEVPIILGVEFVQFTGLEHGFILPPTVETCIHTVGVINIDSLEVL